MLAPKNYKKPTPKSAVLFKHKSVLQCWVCDQPIRGEERRWVRHMDGHAYAYCQKCVDKISKENNDG